MTVETVVSRPHFSSSFSQRWHPKLCAVSTIILLMVGCISLGASGSADSSRGDDHDPTEETESPSAPQTTTDDSPICDRSYFFDRFSTYATLSSLTRYTLDMNPGANNLHLHRVRYRVFRAGQ